MSCASGFYDLIYGGTCWKRPDDTDRRGGWIRSATAVTGDDACWRIPKETLAPATKVKKTFWAWERPSESFWDGYDWGGCWTCPADNPRRTIYPVYSPKACASPVNETSPAVFLAFNGCPKPDAEVKNDGETQTGEAANHGATKTNAAGAAATGAVAAAATIAAGGAGATAVRATSITATTAVAVAVARSAASAANASG
jgi:hypothetical protein